MATPQLEPITNTKAHLEIHRIPGTRKRVAGGDNAQLWFDTQVLEGVSLEESILTRALHWRYTGVLLYPENIRRIAGAVSNRVLRVLHVEKPEQLDSVLEQSAGLFEAVSSPVMNVLDRARELGYLTCVRARVDDGRSLHDCIQHASGRDFLIVAFKDPTNIPLELIIASLQATNTSLIKEIDGADNIDDAVVSLGVMEVGADGVMFTPRTHSSLSELMARLEASLSSAITLEPASVTKNIPLGMGTRSCIDMTTLFGPAEGVLVGSTSYGGILCCPEVFYLPYMDLRPFRINAGSVHSYVYNCEDRTNYISELKAGASMMIVNQSGATRRTFVGRVKTEVRPLRLIEAEFASGYRANIILQDDWHVRIFSDQAEPLNVTEIRPGQRVLGHCADPGRHVGIRVDEQILEA